MTQSPLILSLPKDARSFCSKMVRPSTALGMMKIWFAALSLFSLTAFTDAPLSDPAQEAEAQTLMYELRCLVCQSQSIADSDAEMAVDMRAVVRERIAAGESADDVRDYLITRYGDWVTYSPPKRGANLILWAAPLLLLVIGGFVAAKLFRRPPA